MGDSTAHDKPAEALRTAYARRWRGQRLGQITDELETALILELLDPLAGETIIDVGCGDGQMTRQIADHGARVIGLDSEAHQIAAARAATQDERTKAHYVIGDARALPVRTCEVHGIAAVTVLCFVDDINAAMVEMARVLRPGGRLIIGDLGRWSPWAAIRRVRGWRGHPVWRAAHFRTAEELRGAARAAGLTIETVQGAVFYPPWTPAARLIAPVDRRLRSMTTFGAAFLALKAIKPAPLATPNQNTASDTQAQAANA